MGEPNPRQPMGNPYPRPWVWVFCGYGYGLVSGDPWVTHDHHYSHLREKPPKVVPYTDDRFADAAMQWLIETDQVRGSSLRFVLVHSPTP